MSMTHKQQTGDTTRKRQKKIKLPCWKKCTRIRKSHLLNDLRTECQHQNANWQTVKLVQRLAWRHCDNCKMRRTYASVCSLCKKCIAIRRTCWLKYDFGCAKSKLKLCCKTIKIVSNCVCAVLLAFALVIYWEWEKGKKARNQGFKNKEWRESIPPALGGVWHRHMGARRKPGRMQKASVEISAEQSWQRCREQMPADISLALNIGQQTVYKVTKQRTTATEHFHSIPVLKCHRPVTCLQHHPAAETATLSQGNSWRKKQSWSKTINVQHNKLIHKKHSLLKIFFYYISHNTSVRAPPVTTDDDYNIITVTYNQCCCPCPCP